MLSAEIFPKHAKHQIFPVEAIYMFSHVIFKEKQYF